MGARRSVSPRRGIQSGSWTQCAVSAQTDRQALNREGMIASMSRKGDCWDNAVSESFFGQLKNEWTYGQDYPDRDQARAALYEYIELFYNDQRLHQTLGYIPPVEYEKNQRVA